MCHTNDPASPPPAATATCPDRILRALAILVTESHAEATPDELDHWRATAHGARLDYDRLRAEVARLRALVAKLGGGDA